MSAFIWNEAKRRANLRKHGIAYGERRFLTLGLLQDQVVSVTHTECGDDIRIISVRRATKHEACFYFSQIAD